MVVETGRRQPPPFNGKCGQRGQVTHYSAKSAARHRQMLASVRRDRLPLLACLTYPEDFPRDPAVYKRHLKIVLQRAKRKFPTLGGTWKLEFQERRAAHFHMELWGVPVDEWVSEKARANPDNHKGLVLYSQFVQWLSQTWYEVVGSNDPKHLRAGTSCEWARSVAGAISYASSYGTKVEQTLVGEKVGRYWGAFARQNIPWGEPVERVTTEQQAVCVARTARRLAQSRCRAAHLKRMREAKEGKIKKRGKRLVRVTGKLKRKVHGKKGRKVNRLPRIRASGCFKSVVIADFWLERMPKLISQRPLWRLPRLIGFRPTLP